MFKIKYSCYCLLGIRLTDKQEGFSSWEQDCFVLIKLYLQHKHPYSLLVQYGPMAQSSHRLDAIGRHKFENLRHRRSSLALLAGEVSKKAANHNS